jgi:hypothetical protein
MKMLCNNQHYFEIVKADPSKFSLYGWADDEDKLLWSFKFSPKVYRQEMLCLLRYKSLAMVLERINFV